MGEGNPTNLPKPPSPLDAAKARVAAADAERQAAQKFVTEMGEFANKGDALADEVMAEAHERLDAAAMEVEGAHIHLGRLVIAEKAEREASTPIDELLMGSAAPAGQVAIDQLDTNAFLAQENYDEVKGDPAADPSKLRKLKAELDTAQNALDQAQARDTPSTPVEDLMLGGVPAAGVPWAESPQPNEFEPRPLPPDPEPEPELDLDIDTELEPESAVAGPSIAAGGAPGGRGTSRTAIAAIGGLAIIGAGVLGVVLLSNNGALPGASGSPSASVPSESATTVETSTPLASAVSSLPALGGSWILQGVTGEATGTYDDLASSGTGTLTFDFPQTVAIGQTYVVSATFSGDITAKPGWDGIKINIQVSLVDRDLPLEHPITNGINPYATRQLTINGTVADTIMVTANWSPIPDPLATTLVLQADGGFNVAGTSPSLVATYVRAP